MKPLNIGVSRRGFLQETARTCAGIILLSATPEYLRAGKKQSKVYIERARFTMGTVVTIAAYGESREHTLYATTRAFDEIDRIDRLMSLYKPTSQISLVNGLAGREEVKVDENLIDIVTASKQFSATTDGEFDITVEPLMELWGFRTEGSTIQRMPSDREIRTALDAVGWKNIVLDEQNRTIGLLHRASQIDLGGIAVGYSVDRAVGILKEEGIESAFINHSGDVFALGSPEDAEGWEIAVPNPLHPGEIAVRKTVSDRAVSTSGNYEKYVTINGHRFGHILDPFRGCPSSATISTTVFAPTSIQADALSTGFFGCEEVKTRSLLVHDSNVGVIIMEPDGERIAISELGKS